MSDIRFNQWLHQSGTGGVTQISSGHVGIGTTNPLIPVHSANTATLNVGIITANNIYAGTLNGTLALSNISGITGSFTSDVTINGNLDIVDKIRHIGDTNTAIRFPANDTVSIETSGSEALRIPSTGNVLIGTTTDSNNKVTLYGTNASVVMQNASTGNGPSNGFYIGNGNGTLCYVWNYENDGIYFATNNTTRLRIDSSGHLLLGTSTGGLTDYGDSFTIADANAGMTLRCAATTEVSHIYFADGTSSTAQYAGYVQYNHSSDAMKFGTGSVERVVIDSAGRIGIGENNPTRDVVIKKSGSVQVSMVGATNQGVYLNFGDTDDDNIGAVYYDNGNDRMIIRANTNNAVQVKSNGNMAINDGDLEIGTAGHGISFAATGQGGSSSSMQNELLDDYEEGTWVPVANGFTASATYHANYTKIGRLVHITMWVQTATGSSGNPF